MNEITFSLAQSADKDQLLQLLSDRQDESTQLHGGDENTVFAAGAQIFDDMIANPNIKIIVGKDEANVVAAVTLYFLPRIRTGGHIVIFEDVLIKKDYRGRGVGKQMMAYAITFCKKDDRVKKIKLGSRKDEEGIHAFYEKLGFEHKENLFQLEL